MARVDGPSEFTAAIPPSVLAQIGRQLCRSGEVVYQIEVRRGMVCLQVAGQWYVHGGVNEDTWTYRLSPYGPSTTATSVVPSAGVVHCRYATTPEIPWIGVSPLSYANLTGRLAGGLERRLGEEARSPVGHFLPYPQDPDSDEDSEDGVGMVALRGDIRKAEGRLVLVETTAAGLGEGKGAAPLSDWKQQRFGADPPKTLADLQGQTRESVLNACGIPMGLVGEGPDAAKAQAWRLFVTTTIEPIGKLVEQELRGKLSPEIALSFPTLAKLDVTTRSKAVAQLVNAGVEVNRALELAGMGQ